MKTKNIFLILVVSILVSLPFVIANPQILQYNNGHWYNDRNEEVDPAIIEGYTQISYPTPWIIEVTTPQLYYQNSNQIFDNGEEIIIMKGGTTITMIADTTITLTVTP